MHEKRNKDKVISLFYENNLVQFVLKGRLACGEANRKNKRD